MKICDETRSSDDILRTLKRDASVVVMAGVLLATAGIGGFGQTVGGKENQNRSSVNKNSGGANGANRADKSNTNKSVLDESLKGFGDNNELLKNIEEFSFTDWAWNFFKTHPIIGFGLIILLGCLIYLFWKFTKKEKVAPEKLAKGRTADNEEIREWEYQENTGMFYLGQNFPIGKFSDWKGDVGIPFDRRSQHGFVEAPTGSGKTTCFVVKQLVDDAQSRTVNTITFDRKGKEQFHATSKIYRDLGHRVLYLSPWNKSRSMGFEPLFGADEMELRALVEGHIIISADPNDSKTHYRILEQEILEGVFKTLKRLAMCEGPSGTPQGSKCNYKDDLQAQESEAKMAQIMRERGEKMRPHPNCCMCRRRLATLPYAAHIISLGYNSLRSLVQHYADIWAESPTLRPANASPRTVEMLNGLKGKMRYYLDEGPRQVFSRSDFTLDEIIRPELLGNRQSTILYIDAPQQQGRSAAVLSSVMSQLIYQKINERREIMEDNNWSGMMVKLLSLWFDEIGTFTIPDVNNMLATMRDTNTGAVLLLQDQQQLALFYEKVIPDTIHSNSYYKIYTGTINDKRAKTISESIGTTIASEKSFAYEREGLIIPSDFGRRRTLKQAEVPILAPNEIQFMCKPKKVTDEEAAIKEIQEKYNLDGLAIVSSDRPPFVIKKWSYFRLAKHSQLYELIKDSKEWNRYQLQLIKNQDIKNKPRPTGEKPRFKEENINWEFVPKVYESMVKELSQDENYLPMTERQHRVVNAKCRDLMGETNERFLDGLCRKDAKLQKPFGELSKRDGDRLIVILEEKLKTGGKKPAENTERKIENKIIDQK